ncbi:MAG TPA: clostripain-related cysteine peptidase [Candidatus Ozemobacteraceae bacterium]
MTRVSRMVLVALLVALVAPVWAADAAPAMKDWTIAVYLNADNNLDPFGVEDQKEMSKVGSNDWLNIVTLIDRERGPACYNYIEKGKITKIKDMGELDMGDYKLFIDFAKFVVANYPAKHYVFTMWNHGSGWKLGNQSPITRGISYDDSSNNHITTNQLAVALAEIKKIVGHNIDILNFDACLMQMAEVAYACKDTVDYIVASEETEPGKGTPYDDVLSTLTKTSTPEAFSKSWTSAFIKSYSGGSQGNEDCTQSAIKVAAMGPVFDAMNGLAKATMSGKFSAEYKAAIQKVQKFAYPENVDLIHLAGLLKAAIKDEAIKTACDKVVAACEAAIIQNGNAGYSMKNAKGLAVYLPSDFSLESGYTALDFCKASLWDDMITDLSKKTKAARLVASVENGDLSALRRYVAESKDSADVKKFIVQELNFRLHSEAGLDQSVVTEASALVSDLSK